MRVFENDEEQIVEEAETPAQPEIIGEPPADDEPEEEDLDPVDDVPPEDSPRADDAERAQMLRDQVLKEKIVGVLRKKGVPEVAVEDVLQVTLIAAVRSTALPGGSGRARDQYVLATAGYKAVDYLRNAGRTVAIDHALEPDDVAPAQPQVDLLAERDLLRQVLAVGPSDLGMVVIYARYKLNEEVLKDIAADENVPYEALRKRIKDFEERLRERAQKLSKYGRISGVLAVLLAMGLGGWRLQPVPGMSIDRPGPISQLEPSVSTHVTSVDPLDWAAVLRGEAFHACMSNEWEQCLNLLGAARDLDPDGDSDPAVQAARTDAETGYSSGLKPGRVWTPKGPRLYAAKASK